jgi:hypothetical protein
MQEMQTGGRVLLFGSAWLSRQLLVWHQLDSGSSIENRALLKGPIETVRHIMNPVLI